jgi:chromosome segregation ATPase
MSGYHLRGSKRDNSSSIKSLMYFIDVLAILAFLFMIQSESRTEELSAKIAKQSETIVMYEKKVEEVGEAEISEEIEKLVRENQESKQEVINILSRLDEAIEEKTGRNNQYRELVKKLQLKNRLDVLTAEQKNKDRLNELSKEVTSKEELIASISRDVTEKELALEKREERVLEVSSQLDKLKQKSSVLEKLIEEKKVSLTSLQGQLGEVTYEKESLETSNRSLRDNIVKTEKDILDLKDSLNQKTERINNLTDEQEDAVNLNDELAKNLSFLSGNYSRIEESLAQTSQELVDLKQSNKKIANKNTDLENNVEGLLTKIVQLNSHLTLKNTDTSNFEQRLEEKSKELKRLQDEKTAADVKTDDLQRSVDELVSKYAQLKGKINEKNAGISNLESNINQLKSDINRRNDKNQELESNLDILLGKYSKMNNQLQNKKHVEEGLQKEIQDTTDNMQQLAENHRQAKAKNTALERDLEELLNKVTKLNTNITTKTDQFNGLRKECTELKKNQTQAGESLTDELIEDIRKLKTGKTILAKNIKNQTQQLKDIEKEKKNALSKNKELEQSVDALLDKANNTEKWLVDKNRELADLRKQYENLLQANRDKEDANEDLVKKLQMMRKEKPNVVAKVQRSLLSEKLKELERFGVKVREDGQVILPLTEVSFKRDSAELSLVFIGLLEQLIPKYSEIICRRQEVCDMISEIKIAGFSSPVFEDAYVDPGEISEKSRIAHDYNLDLSHKRATSILGYIKYNMNFEYKPEIVKKLTNVSAYGYLQAKKVPKQLLGKFAKCSPKEYNCSEERYVTISFHLPSDQ